MAADRIQIAEPAPPHCSACFQAKVSQTHVDFGASYDGPVVPALEGTVGVVGHNIDELIICEDCLRAAAALIGLTDSAKLTAQLDQLEAGNAELRAKLAGFEDYAHKLEEAVAAKPQPATRPAQPKRQAAKR